MSLQKVVQPAGITCSLFLVTGVAAVEATSTCRLLGDSVLDQCKEAQH